MWGSPVKILARQPNACPGCYLIFSVWQGPHCLSSDGGISVPSLEEWVCLCVCVFLCVCARTHLWMRMAVTIEIHWSRLSKYLRKYVVLVNITAPVRNPALWMPCFSWDPWAGVNGQWTFKWKENKSQPYCCALDLSFICYWSPWQTTNDSLFPK